MRMGNNNKLLPSAHICGGGVTFYRHKGGIFILYHTKNALSSKKVALFLYMCMQNACQRDGAGGFHPTPTANVAPNRAENAPYAF